MATSATVDPPETDSGPVTLTGELAASELRSGDVLAERFRIDALLGIGGFGVVYRAHDLSLGIDVALKLLRPELARRPEAFERFRQELLLARQVSSAHVVRIHDIAQHAGRWFISMDYVDGESLEQRIERNGPLAADDAVAVTRGLLEGLDAAHRRDVVHRDLKPANILLDREGRAQITDFGIARSLGATGLTQSGMLIGTPEYLSPEQARGADVDARSDLYAVGLILYEMLCGAPPFSGGTPAETVMRRIVAPPPSLARARADLPRWLHAFCDRLLRVSPAQRFASARDALRALETRRVPRAPMSPRRLLVLAAALVACAGAAAALWKFSGDRAAAPVAAASLPRVAWLPLRSDDDADVRSLARAIDEHAQQWLRGDAAHPAVPRRRALDALARQTPGLSEAALARQLPEIAASLAATTVMHGELRRDGKTLVLRLGAWTSAAMSVEERVVRADDAPALFARYLDAMSGALGAAGLRPGPVPQLPADGLPAYGAALLVLDAGSDASTAVAPLAVLEKRAPAAPLVAAALLQAQTAARQDLPAQATRDAIVQHMSADTSAPGRMLYAQALFDDDRGDEAAKALDAARKQYPDDAELALLQARVLVATGAGARALDALRRCVQIDPQDARAWFLLGRTAIQQGEADPAVSDYLTHALVLNRLRGDRAGEAETSNALGVGYERLGQLDAAAAQYAAAAAIREKIGDEAGLAKSLRNLAIVQAVQGASADADATLARVRALLKKSGDRASLADLYNDRGVVAEEHGDYAQALDFYRKALALRQELNLGADVAGSLNNVGFASFSLGDFDNAQVFWQQALAEYNKVDDRNGALRIDESIGLLEIARGHFAAARERLVAALQAAEDHQLPEEAAVAHTYLGQLGLLEGRYADAAASARSAGEIFNHRADQRGAAEAALLAANVALALGDGAGAETVLAPVAADRLSAEQRGERALALARRAELAGDAAAVTQRLAEAAQAVDARSAVGLRVRLEDARAALARGDAGSATKALQSLRGESVRLAEVPLRLQWLELETAAALHAGKPADAAARYREALPLLRTTGRYADAVVLHRLGALALAGAPAEAQAATAAADALESQLVADAPDASRDALRKTLAQRVDSEGARHG